MSKNIFDFEEGHTLSIINCEENHIEARDTLFGPNIYNCYIIECCTNGFFSIIINDNEFHIKEGDCYILMPGDRITHKTTSKSKRSELACFVHSSELTDALKEAGITSTAPLAPSSAYEPICRSIRKMIDLGGVPSAKSNYLRAAEMYKIMSALVDDEARVETSRVIKRAIDIIENEYMKDISIGDIASRVGLERCYFSVLFKRYTSESPHSYLNSVRVEKACALLTLTDLSIADIAIQVGFEPAGFARMFKREKGITPGKYRNAR